MEGTVAVSKYKVLNGTQIKTIAIIAMLIDHIAWSFVPTGTAAGQIMHSIGRLTAPIMCYFIAEGYVHTRSFQKYLIRMIIFAVISQIPYSLKESGAIRFDSFSVIYTLTLGLLAIYTYDHIKKNAIKWMTIIMIGILSIPGDWMFFGIAFCLIFYIYRDNFKKQCIGIIVTGIIEMLLILIASIVSGYGLGMFCTMLFQLAIILSLPILYLYNGNRGGNQYTKWGFYIFYPLHLLILALIKMY